MVFLEGWFWLVLVFLMLLLLSFVDCVWWFVLSCCDICLLVLIVCLLLAVMVWFVVGIVCNSVAIIRFGFLDLLYLGSICLVGLILILMLIVFG